ncbi:MAG TPA: YebC/PmpR family DNA-binding transcriptional regulator [Candidatus Eisenbacteria bacterium]|nr:YebC/PmpR family DNA-binding transcriptional regulator [Candidatus Eisenbacteria bacterium]
MSGHSKWATIKRKKAGIDAKRGKVFTKYIKEISVAARAGGGDPAANPRLRTAIAGAKSVNMPADNIERAIKKGTGELEGVNYEEVSYEGYGPGGIAILMDSLTDNRNRTTGELRHLLTKHGGRMAEAGSVQYMFTTKGQIVVPKRAMDEDTLLMLVLDAGAEDVSTDDPESYEIMTPLSQLESVKAALAAKGITPTSAELAKVPQNTITLSEKDAEVALKLMELLEDHDDVQRLFTNLDISDETLSRLQS